MANDFPSSRNPYFSTQRNARSSLNGFSWKPRPRLSLIAGKQTSKNQFFANLPLARNIKHPWNLSVINFLPARVIVEGKHVDGIFNSLKKTIEPIIDFIMSYDIPGYHDITIRFSSISKNSKRGGFDSFKDSPRWMNHRIFSCWIYVDVFFHPKLKRKYYIFLKIFHFRGHFVILFLFLF